MEKAFRILHKAAFVILPIAILIGLIGVFLPRYKRLHKYQTHRDVLRNENRKIEHQIQDLKKNQERFTNDPEFVERTARNAGRVKENETKFTFTNNIQTTSSDR